jgi:hypothetical protein
MLGNRRLNTGDAFLKANSLLPRKKWSKWVVQKTVQNVHGPEHAILCVHENAKVTRRMATSALVEAHGWYRVE